MSYSVLSSITVSGAFANATMVAGNKDQAATKPVQAPSDRKLKSLQMQGWRHWAKTVLDRRYAANNACERAA
ncbi:MAG: hypothetical protein AAGD92_16605 [Pseudomonadota bacterium]